MEAVLNFGRVCQNLAVILLGGCVGEGEGGPEMRRGQAASVITSGWGERGVTLQLFALHIYVVLFPVPLSHFFILLWRPLLI
jgi:hypothetical protein